MNRDHRSHCTNSWSNLTLKCEANTFVKVDAWIRENCWRTISYLQGYSCKSFSCKKLSYQKHTANTVCKTRRTTLCWMRDKIAEFLFIKLCIWPSLFETYLNKRQIILCMKNSQEFLASQVSVLRRSKATNFSTFNRPFFICTESPCTW